MDLMHREDGLTASDRKRKLYRRPYVQHYGSVSALTASGTGTDTEQNTPMCGEAGDTKKFVCPG